MFGQRFGQKNSSFKVIHEWYVSVQKQGMQGEAGQDVARVHLFQCSQDYSDMSLVTSNARTNHDKTCVRLENKHVQMDLFEWYKD